MPKSEPVYARASVTIDYLDMYQLNGIALDLLAAAVKHENSRHAATNPADRDYYQRRYNAAMDAHHTIMGAIEVPFGPVEWETELAF